MATIKVTSSPVIVEVSTTIEALEVIAYRKEAKVCHLYCRKEKSKEEQHVRDAS